MTHEYALRRIFQYFRAAHLPIGRDVGAPVFGAPTDSGMRAWAPILLFLDGMPADR